MVDNTYTDKDLTLRDFPPEVKKGIEEAAKKMAVAIDKMIFDEIEKNIISTNQEAINKIPAIFEGKDE